MPNLKMNFSFNFKMILNKLFNKYIIQKYRLMILKINNQTK